MSNDNVVKLVQPGILTDRLTEVLRDGARALLTQAGNTCARRMRSTSSFCASVLRIRSKAPSRPSDTGRPARRDASRTGPRSPWCSSWSKARRRLGVALTATTSCQRSFEVKFS